MIYAAVQLRVRSIRRLRTFDLFINPFQNKAISFPVTVRDNKVVVK